VLIALAGIGCIGSNQSRNFSYVKIDRKGDVANTVKLNYLLHVPDTYGKDPERKWPLILFLHGYGERGDDLEILKRQPLPKTLDRHKDFPFIVISPQLPLDLHEWFDLIDPLKELVDKVEATHAVDSERVYLTGLSMGGRGTWHIALRHPYRFAAIAPIASNYKHDSSEIPGNICDLKHLPVWAFNGALDSVIPPGPAEEMVEALKACGGNARYTLYPNAEHVETWVWAYGDPAIYEWLLEQRRTKK
jgi:predicted peptidase